MHAIIWCAYGELTVTNDISPPRAKLFPSGGQTPVFRVVLNGRRRARRCRTPERDVRGFALVYTEEGQLTWSATIPWYSSSAIR